MCPALAPSVTQDWSSSVFHITLLKGVEAGLPWPGYLKGREGSDLSKVKSITSVSEGFLVHCKATYTS